MGRRALRRILVEEGVLRKANKKVDELLDTYAKRNNGDFVPTDKSHYKPSWEFANKQDADNFYFEVARAARSRGFHISVEEPEQDRDSSSDWWTVTVYP